VTRISAVIIAAFLLALVAPPGAGAQPDQRNRMRLDLESLSPRVITAATPAVSVTGKVTNTGDRRINDVKVQLQRGEVLNTEQKLHDLAGRFVDPARSPFVAVATKLDPGESAPVTLTVPVRGTETSLRIETPGVYPLLVNVNGQPDFGSMARLATAYLPVPALSVPGGGNTPVPPDPARLTLLWPLIDDYPRRLPAPDPRPALTDDGLATSLAPGGRLYGLVHAAAQVAATDPALLDAICFAVDPDLLETVQQMATTGYRFRGSAGQLVDGTGSGTAKTWLTALQELTGGRCVISVPYADADLVALSRAGAVDLEKLALTSGATVTDLLKPAPLSWLVLWPAGGTLDQRTLLDLAGTAPTTVIADPAHLHNRQGEAPYTLGGAPAARPTRALAIDTLVSGGLDDAQRSSLLGPDEDRRVSVQNGVAALAFQTAFAGPAPSGGRSILIAPPRRWAAPAAELDVYLQAVRQLLAAHLARGEPLTDSVAAVPSGTATGLDYDARDGAAEITATATADAVRIYNAQRDLVRAMSPDDTIQVQPSALVSPLEFGLLRGTSTAWRGHGDQAARAINEVAAQLDALRAQVNVSNPGRPLTLASGNSPIPVLISNTLPVTVIARVRLADTPGLRPGAIPDVIIPARGAINRYLPAEVIRSGRFTVDVSLSTPGGTSLGSTTRLELTSTAHGSVTLIITGTAAAALFLLAGLRIFRRVRAARAAPPPAEGGAS
jgi:hypothetical protein